MRYGRTTDGPSCLRARKVLSGDETLLPLRYTERQMRTQTKRVTCVGCGWIGHRVPTEGGFGTCRKCGGSLKLTVTQAQIQDQKAKDGLKSLAQGARL